MRTWQYLIFHSPEAESDFLNWCVENEQEFLKAMRKHLKADRNAEAQTAAGVVESFEIMRNSYLREANELRSQIEREQNKGKER